MFGAFTFGQPQFGKPDGMVGLQSGASCSLDETLDALTCDSTATSRKQSAGGGSSRRIPWVQIKPERLKERELLVASLECELGVLELDSLAVTRLPRSNACFDYRLATLHGRSKGRALCMAHAQRSLGGIGCESEGNATVAGRLEGSLPGMAVECAAISFDEEAELVAMIAAGVI